MIVRKLITALLLVIVFASCSSDDSDVKPNDDKNPTFTIYSDADYPAIPEDDIPDADQRYVGGANASDSNDGSKEAPWATLDKALQELADSDTWYCLNFASDITVDSPIDTKSYGSGPGSASQFVYIRSAPSLSAPATLTLNARLEIDGQQNWLWYGFNIEGTDGINIGDDIPTNHHTFRNITGTMTGTGGDNHALIQGLNYNADYFGVFNCNLTGPGVNGVHGNTAAILVFRIVHLRIENNVFTNAPKPFYYKHSNIPSNGPADVHIRYNYQPETSKGEYNYVAGRAEGGTFEIVHNIFGSSLLISNTGGSEQPEGHYIANNTFLTDLGLMNGNEPAKDAILENNVIRGNLELLRYKENTNTNKSDYELINGKIYYQSNEYSLSEWQQNSVPSGQDANSIAGRPKFLVTNPTKPEDYQLAEDSPGVGVGKDGEDMGAKVEFVGNKNE